MSHRDFVVDEIKEASENVISKSIWWFVSGWCSATADFLGSLVLKQIWYSDKWVFIDRPRFQIYTPIQEQGVLQTFYYVGRCFLKQLGLCLKCFLEL